MKHLPLSSESIHRVSSSQFLRLGNNFVTFDPATLEAPIASINPSHVMLIQRYGGPSLSMPSLHLLHLHGPELMPYLSALGALRLQVFREFPYLYDGTLEDERHYLQTYVESPSSLVVLVLDGETAVGATTCLRMSEAEPPFRACFEQTGMDPAQLC